VSKKKRVSSSTRKKIDEIRQTEVQTILSKGKISLILDNYNDLFSDFDPRPYSERALSDDFINESRKAARDKQKAVELKFLMPNKLRNTSDETKIKNRLKEHFKKHYGLLKKESDQTVRKGVALAFLGFVLMVLSANLHEIPDKSFYLNLLLTIVEPSGWFMVWYGLDQIFYIKNENHAELEFYKKMNDATITFDSY
jgi:hypothetical protein